MRRAILVGLLLSVVVVGLPRAQRASSSTEWRFYGGDAGSTKYSPIDQINAGNVSRLEVAWRWKSSDNPIVEATPAVRPGAYEDTPIMAGGVLYTATSLGIFVALDPSTGKVLWQYDPETWKTGRPPNLGYTHRGVAYWTDGRAERIISGIHDAHLISIDAKTGKLDPAFGNNGMVDAIEGLPYAERMKNYAINSAPVIVKNVIIAGANISDGAQAKEFPRGDISGYDVRTGKRLWTFRSVPSPGQFGNDSWEKDSWAFTGNTNVWSLMSVDENLGYVYLPFGTPTDDYYGGNRLGNNLFAESLVCLDATTGKRVWHFQGVHHGLWDYDFPAAPVLGDITVDGRRISAVAQVSKQGFLYVFDRKTGTPVWPIEERPVPQSRVPGERTSPTQPFPTKPPAFERQGMTDDNLIDFTPELRARAIEALKPLDRGPLFTPHTERGSVQLPGNGGGANYNGAAFDPVTRMLYVPSVTSPFATRVGPQDPARGNQGYRTLNGVELPTLDGLPVVKPPYSRMTAYDLDKGTIAWQIPIGDGPRNHPLIKALGLGPLGSPGRGFVLLTKTLLFVSHRGGGTTPPEAPSLRAIDKATGRVVATVPLPMGPVQSPMTYIHQGKQHIVLAVGGGANAELVAFTLRADTAQDGRDTPYPKPSTLPNPYRLVADWPTLPASMKGPNGRKWGEVIRVHVAPDGNVWVFQRCFHDKPAGDATCLNRGEANPPILKFSPAGQLLTSFGVGLFAHPHGFTVDKDGNIWTTDTNDEAVILSMPAKNAQGVTMGQEVLKISPTGSVLMTIGTEGVGGNGPYTFDRPTGVAIAPGGDIFVADGHSRNKSNSARVVKYSPGGRFIKTWGRLGSEPGNFREPHDIYVGGSKGYVYVADRLNSRIQVFDQDGNFIAAWKQFGQPSSVYVDKQDNIYVGAVYPDTDAQSRGPSAPGTLPGPTAGQTTGANDRAIVVGNAITGELKYLIPDPGDLSKMTDSGTSASGIAVDDQGNIYAADVGFNNLRKYVKVP